MLYVYIQPTPGDALDRVHIARPGSDVRLNLAGRRSAVAWLSSQGCCPGAAAMLHGAPYGQAYEIAEPHDPGFEAEPGLPSAPRLSPPPLRPAPV